MSYEIDGVRLVDDVGNVYDIEEWLDLHGYVELPRDANGITDELRKWGYGFCGDTHDVVTAIADRIDAEHEKAMSRAGQLLADAEQDRDNNYANWQECKQKVLQSSITFNELSAEIERLMDELSCRVGLPKDANGECIRVGDEMDGYGKTIEIVELRIGRSGWVIVSRDGNAYADTFAFTHHKPLTVEDVLGEMLYKAHIYDKREMELLPDLIAEYAAKLQLRGESE